MTKNEQFFKILDRMFPGEFKISDGYLIHDKRIFPMDNHKDLALENTFWLAEKVGLFAYSNHFLTKHGDLYMIYESKSIVMCQDLNFIALGKTPQEAIVNAIVAIYGK